MGRMDIEELRMRLTATADAADQMAQEMRSLVGALASLADSVRGVREAKASAPTKPPAPTPPAVPPAADPLKITLKQVQAAAQKAFAAGKDKVIMGIVKEKGLKSLSRVHPDDYAEVLKRIEDAL